MNNKLPDNDLCGKICGRITHYIMSGDLCNDDLVQIIEHVGSYLNLKTRADYARDNGISYNGAKRFRKNVNLFGAAFIIDND